MDTRTQPHPTLASVLATLSSYTPPPTNHPPPPQPPPDLEEGEYDPSTPSPPNPILNSPQPPQQPPSHPLPPPQQQTPRLPPNPTTYPQALHNLTHLLTTTPQTQSRIAHLITTQHAHERQWHAGRVALLEKIAGREARRREMDAVLLAIGGKVSSRPGKKGLRAGGEDGGVGEGVGGDADRDGEAEKEAADELKAYDRKVHRACVDMARAMGKELGGLGVPFFNESEKEEGLWRGREEVLRGLRGRVVGFLEEFCEGGEG